MVKVKVMVMVMLRVSGRVMKGLEVRVG